MTNAKKSRTCSSRVEARQKNMNNIWSDDQKRKKDSRGMSGFGELAVSCLLLVEVKKTIVLVNLSEFEFSRVLDDK